MSRHRCVGVWVGWGRGGGWLAGWLAGWLRPRGTGARAGGIREFGEVREAGRVLVRGGRRGQERPFRSEVGGPLGPVRARRFPNIPGAGCR